MKSASLAAVDTLIPDRVRDALVRDERPAKVLARVVGVVPRQVENWRAGRHMPSVPHFLRLCMELPELRAQALAWLRAEQEIDPDAERLTLDLLRNATRILERRQQRLEEDGPP